jgi:NTE family protein
MDTGLQPEKKAALALSGGGFRATLFHLGSLLRLNELGWLPRLDAVSSVSGGSIVGAYLGLRWTRLEFVSGRARNLREEVIEPIRELCRHEVDLLPSLLNIVTNIWGSRTRFLRTAYARLLFGGATLADLPADGQGPRFVITGSNLQTGSLMTFERAAIADPRLGYIAEPAISLAEAVAVSSAYPPFLSPVLITVDPRCWQALPESDLAAEEKLKRRLVLTDGGMHDPLALQPIWRDYYTLLVSDASHTREVWRNPSAQWLRQLNRTTLMQTFANSAARREVIKEAFKAHNGVRIRNGAYWSNDGSVEDFGLDDPVIRDSSETQVLAEVRTRLNRFSEAEQAELINWGYAMCDAAMRAGLGLANEPAAQLPAIR